jgi:hypothetical protein
MDSELKKKNDELQMENEELRDEIKACYQMIDDLETQMNMERECADALIDLLESKFNRYGLIIDKLVSANEDMSECIELSQGLGNIANKIQEDLINRQEVKIEKFKKAPKENKKNTDTLWEPYRQKFDAYIADGKTESWAKNTIGNLMEKDGVWKKASKKDPEKTITRPDRVTLHRQLVTNRK